MNSSNSKETDYFHLLNLRQIEIKDDIYFLEHCVGNSCLISKYSLEPFNSEEGNTLKMYKRYPKSFSFNKITLEIILTLVSPMSYQSLDSQIFSFLTSVVYQNNNIVASDEYLIECSDEDYKSIVGFYPNFYDGLKRLNFLKNRFKSLNFEIFKIGTWREQNKKIYSKPSSQDIFIFIKIITYLFYESNSILSLDCTSYVLDFLLLNGSNDRFKTFKENYPEGYKKLLEPKSVLFEFKDFQNFFKSIISSNNQLTEEISDFLEDISLFGSQNSSIKLSNEISGFTNNLLTSFESSNYDSFLDEEDEKIPQEDLKIPEEDLKIPEEDEKIPQEDEKIPEEDLKIPEEDLKTPEEDLKIPEEDEKKDKKSEKKKKNKKK